MNEFFFRASRGLNAWWRYGASIITAFILAGLGVTLLILALGLARLLPPDIAAELQQPKHAVTYFLGIAVVFAALTLSLMAMVRLIQRKRPSDLIGHWRWRQFFWGLGVWAALECLLTLIDFARAPHDFALSASSGTAALALSALAGLAVQTFSEEFLFRGYVTQAMLLALKRPLPAALASGLLFGVLHVPNGPAQAINAVLFGIIAALIAIRTGGIALTTGLHLANNYFGAVAVVSTGDVFHGSPGLITQDTPQLLWWDLCLGVLALIGVLWRVWKSPSSSSGPYP